MINNLEVSQAQFDEMQAADYVLVQMYVAEDGKIGRSWVAHIGSQAECEEASQSREMYVVPTGMKLEYDIVSTADLLPPVEAAT